MLSEEMMTKLQTARRAILAVAAVLVAAPLRGARAQAREDQGRTGGQGQVGSPGSGGGASSLIWARNETEFRQALQDGAAQNIVPMFDPRTEVTLTKTILVKQTGNAGATWGANGNHAKVNWGGPGGADMIVYQGVKGVSNRCLFFEKFNFYGNGYDKDPCGSCLKLYAPDGDPGAIYKFTLRDIYTAYGTRGISLEGAVFEGMCENVHGENHREHGFYAKNTNVGQQNRGIVSNIMMVHPNMSRNLGAGIYLDGVYSVNVLLGGFVNNALGGVVATNGIRAAAFCNGENTGESVFVVPNNGYGSLILFNEGSTDGSTRARKFEGGQWVDVGKPMLYLLNRGAGVVEMNGHVATYGGALGSSAVRVIK
jgi:hypothetical protein